MEDAVFINDAAAELARRKVLSRPGVRRAFTYPLTRRGQRLGWRVFAVGLVPGYGATARPLTEAQVEGLAYV